MVAETMEVVTCPSCFEEFSVVAPPPLECPTALDYDCEVCCRPMLIEVDGEGRMVARGLDDGMAP